MQDTENLGAIILQRWSYLYPTPPLPKSLLGAVDFKAKLLGSPLGSAGALIRQKSGHASLTMARGGEAHGSAGLVTHTGRRQWDRASGRSSWGWFLRSEHTASCRTWPTHSALAWVPVWSSLGCLPLPVSWRQGEARTWGAQAQADMLGHSTHVPGAQKRVHGPLGARAPEACCFPAGLSSPFPVPLVPGLCSFSVCTVRPASIKSPE